MLVLDSITAGLAPYSGEGCDLLKVHHGGIAPTFQYRSVALLQSLLQEVSLQITLPRRQARQSQCHRLLGCLSILSPSPTPVTDVCQRPALGFYGVADAAVVGSSRQRELDKCGGPLLCRRCPAGPKNFCNNEGLIMLAPG